MKILRVRDLCDRLGVSRATAYRHILNDPDFPAPRQITPTICGWLSDEVDRWIESRPVAGGGRADEK